MGWIFTCTIPTMLHSEQKCAHFCSDSAYFCSEWSTVGYETGACWDLWNWSSTCDQVCVCGFAKVYLYDIDHTIICENKINYAWSFDHSNSRLQYLINHCDVPFSLCIMYVCMYVWMDGWMDGWIGWVGGWMDGFMDGCMHACVCMYVSDHRDGLSSWGFKDWSSIAQSVCQRALTLTRYHIMWRMFPYMSAE